MNPQSAAIPMGLQASVILQLRTHPVNAASNTIQAL